MARRSDVEWVATSRTQKIPKKRRRQARAINAASLGATGALAGGVAGSGSSGKAVLLGAGLGGAAGTGLGAAIPVPKKETVVTIKPRAVSKSAFGVEHTTTTGTARRRKS